MDFSQWQLYLLQRLAQTKKKEVRKEVIVVPASPTIIIKDPPAKSTTISLDKDGIKVETKKVKVKIDNK